MNGKCFETLGALTFVLVSAVVVEKSCFIHFLCLAIFPLLAERAHFALDPLKAEKCPLYVKIKVDLK